MRKAKVPARPPATLAGAVAASGPSVPLLARARWATLILLALYTFGAGACFSFSRFGFFASRSQCSFLLLSLCVLILYNLSYQYGFWSRSRFAYLQQVVFDALLVTVLIHFSGGAASWVWPLYLIVTVEAVYLLERRSDILCIWGLSALCYGAVLGLEDAGVLPTVQMPFVDHGLKDDTLYLLLIWFFAVILNAAVGIIGYSLMSALRGETQLLKESEERLFAFLDDANDLIHSNAPDGSFLYANDAWLKHLGYRKEELDELRLWDVVHPDSQLRFEEEFGRVLQGQEARPGEILYFSSSAAALSLEGNLSCTFRSEEPVAVWGIWRDITERKRAEEELYRRAHHDPLTGIPNRLLFMDRLRQLRGICQRLHQRIALLYLDLDRFKWINDTLGHAAGDKLLQLIAERLTGCVRDTDTVARLGGDEFVIALGQLQDLSGVELVAAKVLASLGEPFLVDGKEFCIGVSIGISVFPDDGEEVDDLLKKADFAMYCAKEQGRGRYRMYSECRRES